MTRPRFKPHRPGRLQRGAAALEFGLLFLLFFAVLYGIIGYAFMLLVQQGLTQAAAEGARAAVRLDPMRFATVAAYQSAAEALARDATVNALNWLPEPSRTRVQGKVLGAGGFVTSWATGTRSVPTGGTPLSITTRTLTVTVSYPGYASDPLIPILSLPGFGPVPNVPTNLTARASIQLQS